MWIKPMLRAAFSVAVGITVFVWLVRSDASAANGIYMKCAGVQGSSTSARHAGWIDLLSLEISGAAASQATITKFPDASSSQLLKIGATFPSCKIEIAKIGGDSNSQPYQTYALDNVTVRDYTTTASTARNTEKITLGFSRVVLTEVTCDATGRCGTPGQAPASPLAKPSPTPSASPLKPLVSPNPVFRPRVRVLVSPTP